MQKLVLSNWSSRDQLSPKPTYDRLSYPVAGWLLADPEQLDFNSELGPLGLHLTQLERPRVTT